VITSPRIRPAASAALPGAISVTAPRGPTNREAYPQRPNQSLKWLLAVEVAGTLAEAHPARGRFEARIMRSGCSAGPYAFLRDIAISPTAHALPDLLRENLALQITRKGDRAIIHLQNDVAARDRFPPPESPG
jgi:hypothetical protein